MKRINKIIGIIAALVLVAAVAFGVYILNLFYPAGELAHRALQSDEAVSITIEENRVVFAPEQPGCGFIFYPGGTVEYTAYAPLMRNLAENNVLCVLIKMPANLAVLDMYAAEGIPEQYPQIEKWYIGGHSLGGSSAAFHMEKTEDTYCGLVLLAAYSAVDLRDNGVRVCCVYGTEDGVMNRENYRANVANLPDSYYEVIIPGGNHAQFGDYGQQSKDGVALISPEEQISITVNSLVPFFFN